MNAPPRRRCWPGFAAAAVLLSSGCGATVPGDEVRDPPFEECAADSYTFVGESTLAQLGLSSLWPEESRTVADIWITAERVEQQPAVPGGQQPPPQRALCMLFSDGGMATAIEPDWQMPGAFPDLADPTNEGIGGLGLLVGGAVMLIGVTSVLAFRSGSRPPARSE